VAGWERFYTSWTIAIRWPFENAPRFPVHQSHSNAISAPLRVNKGLITK
jgi:hypothetical protein